MKGGRHVWCNSRSLALLLDFTRQGHPLLFRPRIGWIAMRSVFSLVFMLLVAGCAYFGYGAVDLIYGPEDPSHFDQPRALDLSQVDFHRDVKPILDKRCVVCHACYDAPCQLQLGSYEGVTRGANPRKIYDATRLFAAKPTRLFLDANTHTAWRNMGFFPVLNERRQGPDINIRASVLAQMLSLKSEQTESSPGPLPEDRYDFSLDRAQVCPKLEGFSDFRQNHPEWGMPFGFPALKAQEVSTLMRWIEQGAPPSAEPVLPDNQLSRVEIWERFLNGPSPKERLMARYIYEHWFLAHLYFDDVPHPVFFELVRSSTPPGKPIELIATRRPYDDPKVERVYYRLRPLKSTPVAKTHLPYPLNEKKLERIRAWFIDEKYEIQNFPGYDPVASANPFVTFRDLPPRSRYRLMLDEAQFTVMGFIKGPSCRGQTALNVIDDHFWIGFVNPDTPQFREGTAFLADALTQISLPTEQQSNAFLTSWLVYSAQQNAFYKRKAAFLSKLYTGHWRLTLNELWDGDRGNDNAALTVFRHYDSASVEKGLLGGHPQKGLILGYELLERIHYLLVAGFDVYGNLAHQLQARLYMDFLRMEGEQNLLVALPKPYRAEVRDHWYRGASDEVLAYLNGTSAYLDPDTGIAYQTDHPLDEFYDLWKSQMDPILDHAHDLSPKEEGASRMALWNRLLSVRGRGLQYLPENAIVTVQGAHGKTRHYSLIRNSAHSNISEIFKEAERRLPEEDTLYLARGFIGAYPNVFYRVLGSDLEEFVTRVEKLQSEADYRAFADRFAVRRTDLEFWQHADLVQEAYQRSSPLASALLDLSRYENR